MRQAQFRIVRVAGVILLAMLVLGGMLYAQDKLKAGIEAYKKGDYDQAIYLLNQHLSQIPYDYDGNFYLGNAYFQKKDWKEALRAYQKAYQRKAKPEVLYQLGLTCMESGDLPQAAKYAQEGIKSKGTQSEIGQMNYLLAKIQFQQKNYSEADKNLRMALAADPDNSYCFPITILQRYFTGEMPPLLPRILMRCKFFLF